VTTRQPKIHSQLGRAAVQISAANERINQVLIEHLDPGAWRAKPSGMAVSVVRGSLVSGIGVRWRSGWDRGPGQAGSSPGLAPGSE